MSYDFVLGQDEQKELLRIARTTIKEHLLSGRMPPGAPHRKSLIAPAAVFVTLQHGDALRGCIGMTQETTPVFRAVQEMAVAAATRDPRFRPIKLEELATVTIEISVLGARGRITSPEDIVIGKHGLQVTSATGSRSHRGLLLPKVASEHGWDAETFLAHTCEKAGLPRAWWRDHLDAVETFEAQVFDEQTLHTGPFGP
jgi:uncharacterized protein